VIEETRFRQAVPQSNIAVARVLSWLFLSLSGWWLIAKPAVARPASRIITDENTEADIYLNTMPNIDGRRLKRIEVKHRRTVDFTNADDFPYDTIHCDRFSKPRRCDYYFLCNRTLSHAAVIIAKRVKLGIERTFDQGKAGGAFEVLSCQKRSEGILWISLDRPLHLVPA
jgi:hypothetical protein